MSPRTAQQYHDLREASRKRILESALTLFARFGYERTSVRMIAEAAGVSQGLMYNYFVSKEDLLRAIFQRSMEDVQQALASARETDNPAQKLERLIRSSFELVQQHMPFWKLSYSVRMQPAVLAGLAEELQAWMESIRCTLEGHFRELGAANPVIAATMLFAFIDGIAQHYALDPERYPLAAVVEALVAQYCGAAE